MLYDHGVNVKVSGLYAFSNNLNNDNRIHVLLFRVHTVVIVASIFSHRFSTVILNELFTHKQYDVDGKALYTVSLNVLYLIFFWFISYIKKSSSKEWYIGSQG